MRHSCQLGELTEMCPKRHICYTYVDSSNRHECHIYPKYVTLWSPISNICDIFVTYIVCDVHVDSGNRHKCHIYDVLGTFLSTPQVDMDVTYSCFLLCLSHVSLKGSNDVYFMFLSRFCRFANTPPVKGNGHHNDIFFE